MVAEERLSPAQAMRLLHAKGAELEHRFRIEQESLDTPMTTLGMNMLITGLIADIALIATLVSEEMARNEVMRHIHTKTGKVMTDEDFEALAEEAEKGYDVSHLRQMSDEDLDEARRWRRENFPGISEWEAADE